MKGLQIWLYIFGAVAIAVFANSISAVWAKGENKLSLMLLAVIFVSPFVFLSFGWVTSKLGVSITSGVIDSLLTVSTIAIGLLVFGEWNKLSVLQYAGLFFALVGVCLMVFFPKESA